MSQTPNKFWALILVCVVLALPMPRAQHLRADADGQALQPPVGDDGKHLPLQGREAKVIDERAMEARLLARMRHEFHSEVDSIALRSMEQAMKRLREREGGVRSRPIGKVVRLTFTLEPELEGAAPVSVLTRTSAYSAFADTVLGGTVFRLNVAGEVSLKGLDKDRAVVDFSSLLQYGDAANEESGSSGATGSAELLLGEPEVIMSVGARDLVLTVELP